MVYVKYNQQLKKQFNRKDKINFVSLKHTDEGSEWLVGVMDDKGQVLILPNDPTFPWA